MYYDSVNSKLREDLEEREFELPIHNSEPEEETSKKLKCIDKFLLTLGEGIYVVYELAYFHFFPYLVFTIIHLWKNVKLDGWGDL